MVELQIHDEVAAFIKDQPRLSAIEGNPWVVFAEGRFQDRFASFEEAYAFAYERFEGGKFLIRDVRGEEPFIPLMFVAH